jgi:hypothetical protein
MRPEAYETEHSVLGSSSLLTDLGAEAKVLPISDFGKELKN